MRSKQKPAAPVREKGEVVAPVNTLRLIESVGVSRASRALGVSTTTLHKVRKQNLVSKVIEVAAGATLRDISGGATAAPAFSAPAPRSATATFLIEVDESKRTMVEKFAEAMGAKLLAA